MLQSKIFSYISSLVQVEESDSPQCLLDKHFAYYVPRVVYSTCLFSVRILALALSKALAFSF